mgnify:CR=1 FL=1
MSFKSDIQATRSVAAAGTDAIIAQPVRLRGIIIASDGTGAGTLELTTTSSSGTTLFQGDVANGDVFAFNIPEDGVVFPGGMKVSAIPNVTAATLMIDK